MEQTQHTPRFQPMWLASIMIASTASCALCAAPQDSRAPLVTGVALTGDSAQGKATRDPKPAAGVSPKPTATTPPSTPTHPTPSPSAADAPIVRPATPLDRAARVQLLTFSQSYALCNAPHLSHASPTWKLWINDHTVVRRLGTSQLCSQALTIMTRANAADIRLTEEVISSKLRAERTALVEVATLQLEKRHGRNHSKANTIASGSYSDLLCFGVKLPESVWSTLGEWPHLTVFEPMSYAKLVSGSVAWLFVSQGGEDRIASVMQSQQSSVPDLSYLFSSQSGATPPPASAGQGN